MKIISTDPSGVDVVQVTGENGGISQDGGYQD